MQSEVFFVENDIHRRDKTNYYLDLAEAVSQRCTCLRRHYGAVIVKNDEVISTGYVGAPRGRKNCTDIGKCVRVERNIPRGERYELCRSVHAEANAIMPSVCLITSGAHIQWLSGQFMGISVQFTKSLLVHTWAGPNPAPLPSVVAYM